MKITCLIGLLSVLDGVTHKLVLGVSFANILLPATWSYLSSCSRGTHICIIQHKILYL